MRVHALAEVDRPVSELPAPAAVIPAETTGMLLARLTGFEIQVGMDAGIRLVHMCGDSENYPSDVHLIRVVNAAMRHDEVCQ